MKVFKNLYKCKHTKLVQKNHNQNIFLTKNIIQYICSLTKSIFLHKKTQYKTQWKNKNIEFFLVIKKHNIPQKTITTHEKSKTIIISTNISKCEYTTILHAPP